MRTSRHRFIVFVSLLGLSSFVTELSAQNLFQQPDQNNLPLMPNKRPKLQIDMKTMGGRQFWGDTLFFQGYRIQQNVLSQHYRLLDPEDIRREWGTEQECKQALQKIIDAKQLPAMSGKAVILVHGIIRSSKSFSKMKVALEKDGYTVVGFDYPSTRMTMAKSADFLAKTIDSLHGIEQIDLVCHSMGGLLVRTYLKETGKDRDPRLHRLVMMGTPNQGAQMANIVENNLVYQWIFGPAGKELKKNADGVIASLPTPDFEFGIVAGARKTENGWNPLIPGDDDGTVSVESAKLAGAKDFMTVSSLHSFVTDDAEGIEGVRRFLKTGCFRESGVCYPITEK